VNWFLSNDFEAYFPRTGQNKMAQQKSQKGGRKGSGPDVIKLLKNEQKKVKQLFQEFESLNDLDQNLSPQKRATRKEAVVTELCNELISHTKAEEEIFYPAVCRAIAAQGSIKELELMDELAVEKSGIQALLDELMRTAPDDRYYDARVRVLRKYLKRHRKELKDKIFPVIKKSGLDTQALGEDTSSLKNKSKITRRSSSRTSSKASKSTSTN
jgi:hemerythrin superfamily protein